jgi:hypothetical protein
LAKPIRITVKGNGIDGEDAPTVEDLLYQIQDLVGVLKGVEEALSEDGKKEIVWRVTNVTRNSPIAFELTPYPKTFAMNIENRAQKVIASTAAGFQALINYGERPKYFSNELVARIEKVIERVTNGLSKTAVDFTNYGAESIEIDKSNVDNQISSVKNFLTAKPVQHKELGTVEGSIIRVELDGFQRPVLWLKSRLDGQNIKCIAIGGALDRIGHYELAEVLSGLRIAVYGIINYKDVEEINSVDVESVHVFPEDNELPEADKIVSADFTKGVEAVSYLEAMRRDA